MIADRYLDANTYYGPLHKLYQLYHQHPESKVVYVLPNSPKGILLKASDKVWKEDNLYTYHEWKHLFKMNMDHIWIVSADHLPHLLLGKHGPIYVFWHYVVELDPSLIPSHSCIIPCSPSASCTTSSNPPTTLLSFLPLGFCDTATPSPHSSSTKKPTSLFIHVFHNQKTAVYDKLFLALKSIVTTPSFKITIYYPNTQKIQDQVKIIQIEDTKISALCGKHTITFDNSTTTCPYKMDDTCSATFTLHREEGWQTPLQFIKCLLQEFPAQITLQHEFMEDAMLTEMMSRHHIYIGCHNMLLNSLNIFAQRQGLYCFFTYSKDISYDLCFFGRSVWDDEDECFDPDHRILCKAIKMSSIVTSMQECQSKWNDPAFRYPLLLIRSI